MTSSRLLHYFALILSAMTVVLLCAGALVTSTGSGLAVPDWPLSYGQFFPPMVGGILFEHGHRLVAGTVAICTVLLTTFVWMKEPRRWVRILSLGMVVAVLCQATLGGLTVLLRLPPSVSVAHACLAQIFFCLTIVLSVVTSPTWQSRPFVPLHDDEKAWISLSSFSLLVCVVFFIQLVLGAVMRHTGAGLAIPDFPLAFGGLIPPNFTPAIAIHFAHRCWAAVVVFLVALLARRIYSNHAEQLELIAWVGSLLALLAVQVMLGASVIWLRRPIVGTSVHLVVGALCFGTSVALACRIHKLSAADRLPAGIFVGHLRPLWEV